MELPDRILWRVGCARDPIAFPLRADYAWSNRFDDLRRRWRTVYCAGTAETALREVLADLRPNADALARYIDRLGAEALAEAPAPPIPRAWRTRTALAPVRIVLQEDARVLDLTDAHECRRLEALHARLLVEHRMERLALHEITTRRRDVTRAIATRAYDDEHIGVVCYPSSIDLAATPCYALIEGRARLELAGEPLLLTDPPPPALEQVAAEWGLPLQPAPARVRRRTPR